MLKRIKSWFRPEEKTLNELQQQLKQLETQLHELSKQGLENHITIETLNVDHPSLEHLTFQLDSIKLDEVSGALNLGNNFGITVKQQSKKKCNQRPKSSSTNRSVSNKESSFERTANGFQCHFHQD